MQLDRGDQYSELHHKFAGPEMLEFLAMPERVIGGVRRGCCPGTAPLPHVPEPEPLSLPVGQPRSQPVPPRTPGSVTDGLMRAATSFRALREMPGSISKTRRRVRLTGTTGQDKEE